MGGSYGSGGRGRDKVARWMGPFELVRLDAERHVDRRDSGRRAYGPCHPCSSCSRRSSRSPAGLARDSKRRRRLGETTEDPSTRRLRSTPGRGTRAPPTPSCLGRTAVFACLSARCGVPSMRSTPVSPSTMPGTSTPLDGSTTRAGWRSRTTRASVLAGRHPSKGSTRAATCRCWSTMRVTCGSRAGGAPGCGASRPGMALHDPSASRSRIVSSRGSGCRTATVRCSRHRSASVRCSAIS